jgi:hypothetical protein
MSAVVAITTTPGGTAPPIFCSFICAWDVSRILPISRQCQRKVSYLVGSPLLVENVLVCIFVSHLVAAFVVARAVVDGQMTQTLIPSLTTSHCFPHPAQRLCHHCLAPTSVILLPSTDEDDAAASLATRPTSC